MSNVKIEVKDQFKYEGDTKRYHRFRIEIDKGIAGTLYVPKSTKPLPERSILDYARQQKRWLIENLWGLDEAMRQLLTTDGGFGWKEY